MPSNKTTTGKAPVALLRKGTMVDFLSDSRHRSGRTARTFATLVLMLMDFVAMLFCYAVTCAIFRNDTLAEYWLLLRGYLPYIPLLLVGCSTHRTLPGLLACPVVRSCGDTRSPRSSSAELAWS